MRVSPYTYELAALLFQLYGFRNRSGSFATLHPNPDAPWERRDYRLSSLTTLSYRLT